MVLIKRLSPTLPKLFATELGRSFLRVSKVTPRLLSASAQKKMELPVGTFVGFGNPLLDITCNVDDNLLLEKYGLEANEAIIAEEKHMPLFEELSQMEGVKYSAGGACQNSLRVFQWITDGEPFRSTFYGAVGNDRFGELVAKRAKANGVETRYQIKDNTPTGTCAVIIAGANRSLVANLGAAASFDDEQMDSEENQCVLERAQTFYVTGFFLAVSPPTVMRVAKFAHEHQRTFVFNLSATFVMSLHKEDMCQLMPYVDIIIGNKEEALAFGLAQELETKDPIEIGLKMQAWQKVSLKPRIVLLTDALCPILMFTDEGKIKEYPIPKVDKSQIVDTNGCGDAFVGGFFAQYCQKMPLDYCIRAGIWTSQQVLKVVGVSLETLPKFQDSCI